MGGTVGSRLPLGELLSFCVKYLTFLQHAYYCSEHIIKHNINNILLIFVYHVPLTGMVVSQKEHVLLIGTVRCP